MFQVSDIVVLLASFVASVHYMHVEFAGLQLCCGSVVAVEPFHECSFIGWDRLH